MARAANDADVADVAIVGAGPVGVIAANLCGVYGLSAVVFRDEIYVLGGSFLDDPVFGGPPVRVYFNDVWRSSDGVDWVG